MGGRKPVGFRRDDAYLGGRPEGSLGAVALTYGDFELAGDEHAGWEKRVISSGSTVP